MRALVLSVGGLRGAYDAGVTAALCRKLGHKYFDAIYMSSVGCFAGTFYAANQPYTMENTWRKYVSGKQLVNYLNPFIGRNILDTEYLIDIFKTDKSKLDLDAVFSSGVKLVYVLENLETAEVEYMSPTRENIFDIMLAGSAVPIIHKPVKVDGITYIDGSLVDPVPIQKAISDGHTEIVLVYNKPATFIESKWSKFVMGILSMFVPKKIGKQIRNLANQLNEIEADLKKESNITIIRPDFPMQFSILNTNRRVIHELIDAGLKDGMMAAEKLLS